MYIHINYKLIQNNLYQFMSYDTFQLGANSTPVDLEISWLQLDRSESAGTREP